MAPVSSLLLGLLLAALPAGGPPPGGSTLEGRVVDEAGNPVGGAAVLVLPAGEGEEEPPAAFDPPAVPRPGDPGERIPAWRRTDLRADGEGRFRAGTATEGDQWVLASLEGMREGWVRARPGGDAVEVVVPGPREIAGRCVDGESGEPVAGIAVWYGADAPGGWVTLLEEPTDPDGRFRLRGLLPGTWKVILGGGNGAPGGRKEGAYRDDYLRAGVEGVKAGTTDLVVKVSRGLSLSGRVLDDRGEPAPGVHVEVVRQSASGGFFGSGRDWILTGPDGGFEVRGLPPGLYGVKAGAETERANWIRSFHDGSGEEEAGLRKYRGGRLDRIPAGSAGLVLRVDRVVTISGVAEEAAGKRFRPGAEVPMYVIRASGPLLGSSLGLKATLKGDGTFVTEPLEPGALYDVCLFRGQGLGSGAVRGIEAGAVGVVMRVGPGRDISGVVVDGDGKPVGAGVPVEAVATGLAEGDPGGHRTASTAADGSFLLPGLGEMGVVLSAGGGDSPWLRTTDPHEFLPGEPGVTLAVRTGAVVAGRLLDGEGRPVRAAWVAAGNGPAFPCGEDGSFRIGGLAPGKVRLSAWVGGREADLGEVAAPADGIAVAVPGPR